MQDAAELKRFLNSDRPLLLILGTGHFHKSQLLSKAFVLSDPKNMVFRLKGRGSVTPTFLIKLFSKHWAITKKEFHSHRIEEILDYNMDCLIAYEQKCLLLVEQAHLLPISVLALLCHLSQRQENKPLCIQIILAGHPELSSKISALNTKKLTKPPVIYLSPITKNKTEKAKKPRRFFVNKKMFGVLGVVGSVLIYLSLQNTSIFNLASHVVSLHAFASMVHHISV